MEVRTDVGEAVEAMRASMASDNTRVVVSPYRVCPIGAHSDHQGGPVLGMTVDVHTLLAFVPSEEPRVDLVSENFPGTISVPMRRDLREETLPPWGRYAEAAVAVFSTLGSGTPRGFVGRVRGALPGGGLASSASVILAYLEALAERNGLTLEPREKIRLALAAEREHLGMRVGILDPGTIVSGRRDRLIAIDTETSSFDALPLGPGAAYRILVVFSGTPRQLTATPYNARVDQCFEAARALAAKTGRKEVSGLNAFEDEEFARYGSEIPEIPRRRARHFFTERSRVRRGIESWERGELERFGELMNESCRSSIENWESGSKELVAIQRILERTPGVLGSRFSGAGFGGCLIAFVRGEDAPEVQGRVERRLDAELPEAADARKVFLVGSDDGIRVR